MNNTGNSNKPLIRLAASLILIQKQEKGNGYDVLMMKRANTASFKSATVFPGGAVDKADSLEYWKNFNFIKNTKNEEDKNQLIFKLTAIRETFEESGVLLTKPQLSLSDQEVKEWREKLEAEPANFIEMCKYYNVSPDVDALYYVSHWMPPEMIKKKFSTHFFAYLAPNPIAFHLPNTLGSQRELTSLEYNSPSTWLKLQEDSVIFFPPQFYICSVLANCFPTFDSIELHLNTPPQSAYPLMMPKFQAIDESLVDLKALGIDPTTCDGLMYNIYPDDFQYSNNNLNEVHLDPLLNDKLNSKINYHRILAVYSGGALKSVRLITNLPVINGRFLVYKSSANDNKL